MWRGGGSPHALVATSAAAPWVRLLPPDSSRPPPPLGRAAPASKEAHGLPFRSLFARGPWEGGFLLGRRSLASSRARDGVPATRRRRRCLQAQCGAGAAATAGGALPWLRDAGAAGFVMAGAYGLVLVFDVLTQRGLIDQKLSRKTVHILSGILFMSSWPIFSSSTEARFFAALAPFVNCLRLTVYGLSLATDEGLIKSVTREGKPEYFLQVPYCFSAHPLSCTYETSPLFVCLRELMRGPLYYVLVLMFCVLVFWRDSPVGVISLAMMSGGDGIADIMGRNFGVAKLPYNNRKSWVGSICMFTFGFLVSMGMLCYFSSLGYFDVDWAQAAKKVAVVSLTATLVESLPVSSVLDDNISVPLATMLTASLLFGYGIL